VCVCVCVGCRTVGLGTHATATAAPAALRPRRCFRAMYGQQRCQVPPAGGWQQPGAGARPTKHGWAAGQRAVRRLSYTIAPHRSRCPHRSRHQSVRRHELHSSSLFLVGVTGMPALTTRRAPCGRRISRSWSCWSTASRSTHSHASCPQVGVSGGRFCCAAQRHGSSDRLLLPAAFAHVPASCTTNPTHHHRHHHHQGTPRALAARWLPA
jgi:hypothetical protein